MLRGFLLVWNDVLCRVECIIARLSRENNTGIMALITDTASTVGDVRHRLAYSDNHRQSGENINKKSLCNLGRAASPPRTVENNYATKSLLVTVGCPTFTPNCPFHSTISTPSNTPSLDRPHSPAQTASRSNPMSRFATVLTQDRPTDTWAWRQLCTNTRLRSTTTTTTTILLLQTTNLFCRKQSFKDRLQKLES